MHTPIVDQIVKQVETLPEEKQIKVLEYVEQLHVMIPRGVPGKDLLRSLGPFAVMAP